MEHYCCPGRILYAVHQQGIQYGEMVGKRQGRKLADPPNRKGSALEASLGSEPLAMPKDTRSAVC